MPDKSYSETSDYELSVEAARRMWGDPDNVFECGFGWSVGVGRRVVLNVSHQDNFSPATDLRSSAEFMACVLAQFPEHPVFVTENEWAEPGRTISWYARVSTHHHRDVFFCRDASRPRAETIAGLLALDAMREKEK